MAVGGLRLLFKDKPLLAKQTVNKKVEVEFVKLGADYVVIAVK